MTVETSSRPIRNYAGAGRSKIMSKVPVLEDREAVVLWNHDHTLCICPACAEAYATAEAAMECRDSHFTGLEVGVLEAPEDGDLVVLVVPPEPYEGETLRKALVAWNKTREVRIQLGEAYKALGVHVAKLTEAEWWEYIRVTEQ